MRRGRWRWLLWYFARLGRRRGGRCSKILLVLEWWGGEGGGGCFDILLALVGRGEDSVLRYCSSWGRGGCLLLNLLTQHQPLGVVWKYEILNVKTFHLMCAIPTLSELRVLHLATSPHHFGRFRKYETLKYSSLEILQSYQFKLYNFLSKNFYWKQLWFL